MLITFLCWMYISWHSFVWGDFFSALISKNDKKQIPQSLWLTIFIGLVFITLYAQIYHFFGNLAENSQILLNVLTAMLIGLRFKPLKAKLTVIWQNLKREKFYLIIGLLTLLFIYLAQSTASPAFHDTDLYHAQTIKWIESYKAVPGLGNLYSAFALNSSVFPLYGLFSFSFIFGQAMHAIPGMVVFWLVTYCYFQAFGYQNGDKVSKSYKVLTSLFLFFLLYNPFFTEFVAALYPDIIANIFAFFAILLWIKGRESTDFAPSTIKYILIFSLFAVSVKLSMAWLLLINLFFWRFYLKNSRNFLQGLLLTGVVMIPFVLKTALLSGYLFYPFYQLDVLNVDWKMPEQMAVEELMWIRSWIKVPEEHYSEVLTYPFSRWFPIYLSQLLTGDFVILFIFALLPLYIVAHMFLRGIKNFHSIHKKYSALYLVCFSGLVVWFLTSPDPRFGYVYFLPPLFLVLTNLLTEGYLFLKPSNLIGKLKNYQGFVHLMALGLLVLTVAMIEVRYYPLKDALTIHATMPRSYGIYLFNRQIVNDVLYYYPYEGDRMGYDTPLPASPYLNKGLRLRGETIEAGFRINQ